MYSTAVQSLKPSKNVRLFHSSSTLPSFQIQRKLLLHEKQNILNGPDPIQNEKTTQKASQILMSGIWDQITPEKSIGGEKGKVRQGTVLWDICTLYGDILLCCFNKELNVQ